MSTAQWGPEWDAEGNEVDVSDPGYVSPNARELEAEAASVRATGKPLAEQEEEAGEAADQLALAWVENAAALEGPDVDDSRVVGSPDAARWFPDPGWPGSEFGEDVETMGWDRSGLDPDMTPEQLARHREGPLSDQELARLQYKAAERAGDREKMALLESVGPRADYGEWAAGEPGGSMEERAQEAAADVAVVEREEPESVWGDLPWLDGDADVAVQPLDQLEQERAAALDEFEKVDRARWATLATAEKVERQYDTGGDVSVDAVAAAMVEAKVAETRWEASVQRLHDSGLSIQDGWRRHHEVTTEPEPAVDDAAELAVEVDRDLERER